MLVDNNMLDHAGAQAITHHTTQHSKSQCTSNTTSCNSAQQVSVQDTIHTANSVRAPSRWDLYCNRKPLHMRMQEYLREKKGPGSWNGISKFYEKNQRAGPSTLERAHTHTETHTHTHAQRHRHKAWITQVSPSCIGMTNTARLFVVWFSRMPCPTNENDNQNINWWNTPDDKQHERQLNN